MSKNIGFIGSGNMANAIIKGLFNSYKKAAINSNNIIVYDTDISKVEQLEKNYNVIRAKNNIELAKESEVIVLAIKPNVYNSVLSEIKEVLTSSKILITMAAGIGMSLIESYSKTPLKVIRIMPNMPVSVGQGMIAISKNSNISDGDLELVVNMFRNIGRVDVIDEELMNMIPAISGSSPAFVYMFIEALGDGAVLQGMSRDKAYKYAAQAVLGAAKMVLETDTHPGELKDMVCSPGGTTIEAVYSLEKSGFRGSIIEAMNICTKKSEKIAKK